jgi:hypothetical protein
VLHGVDEVQSQVLEARGGRHGRHVSHVRQEP